MTVSELQYLLGMLGTVAFAFTAVLAVSTRGIDLYGACVMGLITAIGGGTVRDLILEVPVFWAADLTYIWVALVSSVASFMLNRLITRKDIYRWMLYIDALGVSLFSIQAAHKVMKLNFGMPLGPILLGIITAIGGGLIRDSLAGRTNLLMSNEIYAIPVTIGCIFYVILLPLFPGNAVAVGIGCVCFIFIMRAIVIFRTISVPLWMTTHPKQS